MKSELLILCAYFAINTGCPPMLYLKHGRIIFLGRISVGFACNDGHYLVGSSYAICLDGNWDAEKPVCVQPTCEMPQRLKGGTINPSHAGGVANFYCLGDYFIQGDGRAYCVDMKWSTYLPTCLLKNVTPSITCDFETEDICGWSHDLNHDFDWTRLNSKTPGGRLVTGPSDDHTKGPGGNGYYMQFNGSSKRVNDTARLISPVHKKQLNNTCLEFYYHMYGSGIGQLRVYVKKITRSWDLNVEDAVFIVDGNQGDEWWRGIVELGTIHDQFQIIFEGVRGRNFMSDIAIDDVRIIENCVIDPIRTTERVSENDVTSAYDSCKGKCNNTTRTSGLSCGCDEICTDDNSCCADYVAVCVLANDTDTTNIELDDSTTKSFEEGTTISSLLTSLMTSPISLPTTISPIATTTSSLPTYFTTEWPKLLRLPANPSESKFPPTTTLPTTIANDRHATMRILRDPTTPAPSATTKRTAISDFVTSTTSTPKIITKDIPPVLSNETIVIAVPAVCFIVICSLILLTATI